MIYSIFFSSLKSGKVIIDRIGRIENVVNGCIERLIDGRKSIQIDAISLLIRAYANQKGLNIKFYRLVHKCQLNLFIFSVARSKIPVLKKTGTLDKLIKKLEEIGSADDVIITARTIQIVTGSLNKIVFVVPKLCERMLGFVNEHRNIIGGDTVAYLLFYLFSMGYEPCRDSPQPLSTEEPKGQYLNAELFDFDNFIRIIDRDFELLPAWLIVQACLALSFYQV